MSTDLRLTEIALDCHDPERLAAFYAELLGWQELGRHQPDQEGGYVQIGPHEGAEPTLLLVQVPDPTPGKLRMHLDLSPRPGERDAQVERALSLGATRVDIGQGEQTWVVLGDPEGNEFCILRGRALPGAAPDGQEAGAAPTS
ncbi:MAG: VOC family protein [Motilibacteraceae bacterium]